VSQPVTQQDGVFGFWRPETTNNDFNILSFIVQSMLSKVNVATIVQVKAVHTTGRVAPVGMVDVVPLVDLIDGSGVAWPHTTIFNVPFMRIQGGANAVICDPQVGDVGFCVFADRDLSSTKASGAAAPPASARRFSFSDALYIGGWMSKTAPQHYIVVDDTGVKIEGGPLIELDGTDIQINMSTLEATASSTVTLNALSATVNCSQSATVNATTSISLNALTVTANGVTIT